jgi:heparin/heparan-sulfate lyase
MLWPAREGRTVEILSGAEANSVFGRKFTPPVPAAAEANGHRIMFSPKEARPRDRFLTVMQACDAEPLPIEHAESDVAVTMRIADRVVILAKSAELLSAPFEVTVPQNGQMIQVLCAGLQAGRWRIASPGAADRDAAVDAGKNTLFIESAGGRYRISPRTVKARGPS